MLKKTAWIVLLLAALMALSVTAVWAGGIRRPAQQALLPSGGVGVAALKGESGARHFVSPKLPDRHGHCFMGEDAAAAEAAY